jgi:hypothetical protein
MDRRQSYGLAYRQDDYAAPSQVESGRGAYEILYIVPANDNLSDRDSRSSIRWSSLIHFLLRCTKVATRFRATVTHE